MEPKGVAIHESPVFSIVTALSNHLEDCLGGATGGDLLVEMVSNMCTLSVRDILEGSGFEGIGENRDLEREIKSAKYKTKQSTKK